YLASEESLWDLYERWRSHHTISLDLTEKQKRFNVFQGESETYPQYMTNHEFMSTRSSKISRYLMLHGPRRMTGFRLDKVDSIPHSIDWRKKGAVIDVTGSCCAFSTVVAVEGSDGGLMEPAFEFIKQSDGLTTENNYPYEAKDESCNSSRVTKETP
ncbi:hypothetical protein Goklo_026917, partial [Gossypium klotzschianum]|nr:hypothetical protein [Gossypium klotzschianum]